MPRPATTGVFKTREKLEKEVVRLSKKSTYAEVAQACGIGAKTAWLIDKHQKKLAESK